MGSYLAMDLDVCRAKNHKFKIVGSDKTPMKRHLMCVTCTDLNPGKSAYVAYCAENCANWGQWRTETREKEQ